MEDEIMIKDAAFMDGFEGRVNHGFFGRRGGVSGGLYESLNCGAGSGDAPSDVVKNREVVSEALGCSSERLLSLYQVHGALCLRVDEAWAQGVRPEADAFVTDRVGIALGILTADCAPVLFCGKKSDGAPVVGAAHAGWGGAFRGVLEATVEQMVSLGAEVETIAACIGPCITQGSYEVGPEFLERFLAQDAGHGRHFKKASERAGHHLFDLTGYAADRLRGAGVDQVYVTGIDTYALEQDYFSYRRATHRGEKDYGRQISAIMIKS